MTIKGVSLQKLTKGKTKTEVIDVQFSAPVSAAAADSITAYTLTTVPQGKKHIAEAGEVEPGELQAAATEMAMLTPKKSPLALSSPLILTINGSDIVDTVGRPIDGNNDGQPGGNYEVMLSKTAAIVIRAYRSGRTTIAP